MKKEGNFSKLAINPHNPNNIFALGVGASASVDLLLFHKSSDGGENWSEHTVCQNTFSGTPALAFSPFEDDTIFIGFGQTNKGTRRDFIYKTTDGGENWDLIHQFTGIQINDMAVDPDSPHTIYIASSKGVLLSEDSGSSWESVFDTMATSVVISTSDSSEVYAGCYDGVFASFDGGQSWTKLSDENEYPYVHCLEINDSTHFIYAGIHESGIRAYRESEKHFVAILSGRGGTTKPKPALYFYSPKTRIEIAAIPGDYYEFAGWSGSRSGTVNPMTLTVDADMTIKANFFVPVFPPDDFHGEKVTNRSLTMREYINILKWQRNPDNSQIKGYELYRIQNGISVLIAELEAETFECWDKGVIPGQESSYGIVAVHITGEKSDPAYTTVK